MLHHWFTPQTAATGRAELIQSQSQSFFQVSDWGAESQGPEAFSIVFPWAKSGCPIVSGASRHELAPLWDASARAGGLVS